MQESYTLRETLIHICVVVLPAARYDIVGHRLISECSTVGLVQCSDKAKITGSSPVIPTIFICGGGKGRRFHVSGTLNPSSVARNSYGDSCTGIMILMHITRAKGHGERM